MIQKKTDLDTTIEDIHRTRERIHDAFHGDLKAMLDDARCRQAASGRAVWSPLALEGVTAEPNASSQSELQHAPVDAK